MVKVSLLITVGFVTLVCGSDAGADRGTFDEITYEDIVATPLSGDAIVGNDDETNEIPTGTIVVYQTNQGRYGKLLIQAYGLNLTIRWHTYTLDGTSAYSSGTGLVVNATCLCDLDEGYSHCSNETADFHWEIISGPDRQLSSWNGATFAVYGSEVPAATMSWTAVKIEYR